MIFNVNHVMPKDRYAFQLAIFVVLGVLAIDLFSHL